MAENMLSRIQKTKNNGLLYFRSASLTQKKNDMCAFNPHFLEAQKSLERAVKKSKSLSELGQNVPFDFEEILYSLRQVNQDLESGNFNPRNAELLKIALKKAEQDCGTVWKKYVEEQIGGTRSILQSIRGVASEENDYKEMRKAEVRLSASDVGSQEAIIAIQAYLQHFNSLIEKLQLDDEVLDFLKKMTENNAVPLSDLSQSCLEKLRNESFSGKLKIVIG